MDCCKPPLLLSGLVCVANGGGLPDAPAATTVALVRDGCGCYCYRALIVIIIIVVVIIIISLVAVLVAVK